MFDLVFKLEALQHVLSQKSGFYVMVASYLKVNYQIGWMFNAKKIKVMNQFADGRHNSSCCVLHILRLATCTVQWTDTVIQLLSAFKDTLPVTSGGVQFPELL